MYAANFLSTLIPKAQRKWQKYPGLYDIERVSKCDTIGEFDDEVKHISSKQSIFLFEGGGEET